MIFNLLTFCTPMMDQIGFHIETESNGWKNDKQVCKKHCRGAVNKFWIMMFVHTHVSDKKISSSFKPLIWWSTMLCISLNEFKVAISEWQIILRAMSFMNAKALFRSMTFKRETVINANSASLVSWLDRLVFSSFNFQRGTWTWAPTLVYMSRNVRYRFGDEMRNQFSSKCSL